MPHRKSTSNSNSKQSDQNTFKKPTRISIISYILLNCVFDVPRGDNIFSLINIHQNITKWNTVISLCYLPLTTPRNFCTWPLKPWTARQAAYSNSCNWVTEISPAQRHLECFGLANCLRRQTCPCCISYPDIWPTHNAPQSCLHRNKSHYKFPNIY